MRLINRAIASRVPQCSSCRNRWYYDSHPLVSFVMSPGGGVLCSECVAVFARAPTEEAVVVSRVLDVYRILIDAASGQSEVEHARDLSKQGWRLTHLLGHVGEPAVAAAMMKPHGRGPHFEELEALMARALPTPQEETPPMQMGLPRLRCSFCHRVQRDTSILYHFHKQPGTMGMTLCAECHIVACELLRRHGCLPEIRVDIRPDIPYTVNKRIAPPSNTCSFCESLRDDDMLLRGPHDAIVCFRCVTALLKMVRDDEQRRGRNYPGVTVQDYAFMPANDLRTRTRDILKEGARWYPRTWTHKRKDGISACMYRSPSGIRVRVCTDMMPAPQGWITKDASTERPPITSEASLYPEVPPKPLSRRCAFCHQEWKNVPGMGRNKHANPAIPDAGTLQIKDLNLEICYECIVLANDTFEQDGTVFASASEAEENVPVIWTPTDNGEPQSRE